MIGVDQGANNRRKVTCLFGKVRNDLVLSANRKIFVILSKNPPCPLLRTFTQRILLDADQYVGVVAGTRPPTLDSRHSRFFLFKVLLVLVVSLDKDGSSLPSARYAYLFGDGWDHVPMDRQHTSSRGH